MKVLLDRHTLLWWHAKIAKLSDIARDAIEDLENDVYISVVNAWEIQIKTRIGKISSSKPLNEIIDMECSINGAHIVPISLVHIDKIGALPLHHKDPFDRPLVAQARLEGMTLISKDPLLRDYDVDVLW